MADNKNNEQQDPFKIYRDFENYNLDVMDLYEFYQRYPSASPEYLKKIVDSNKAKLTGIEDETTIKHDITLNVNNFNKLDYSEDVLCIARMLQNILLTNPGTYPNNPTFGVGIEYYLFDFANEKTKSELTSKIIDQINTWLNTNQNIIITPEIKFVKTDNNTYTTLAVMFNVSKDSVTTNKNQEYNFTIFFTGDTTNRKIVSKIDL